MFTNDVIVIVVIIIILVDSHSPGSSVCTAKGTTHRRDQALQLIVLIHIPPNTVLTSLASTIDQVDLLLSF